MVTYSSKYSNNLTVNTNPRNKSELSLVNLSKLNNTKNPFQTYNELNKYRANRQEKEAQCFNSPSCRMFNDTTIIDTQPYNNIISNDTIKNSLRLKD
jgi:hypothetical protein